MVYTSWWPQKVWLKVPWYLDNSESWATDLEIFFLMIKKTITEPTLYTTMLTYIRDEKYWFLFICVTNVHLISSTKITPSTEKFAYCKSFVKESQFSGSPLGYVYNTSENAVLVRSETSTAAYHCYFDLQLFPFDVHVCNVEVKILNSGSFSAYFDTSVIIGGFEIFRSSEMKLS